MISVRLLYDPQTPAAQKFSARAGRIYRLIPTRLHYAYQPPRPKFKVVRVIRQTYTGMLAYIANDSRNLNQL